MGVKYFLGVVVLIINIFFNELSLGGLRLRYLALSLAFIFIVDFKAKRILDIRNYLLIILLFFSAAVYLNGWYKQLGVFSGFTLYLGSFFFFLAGEKSYDRVFFYRLSLLVISIHTLFFFIQFYYPDVYNEYYNILNLENAEISRGYFFTGFRPTSILTSFDLVIFGGFCYNYLFYYKRSYKLAHTVFIFLFALSALIMSRSNLLVLTLNLLFNLYYTKKYLLLNAVIIFGFITVLLSEFAISILEVTRELNLDDGGRGVFIGQALDYVFSHNFIFGEFNENLSLDKAPHNVFINALLYFGLIGFLLVFVFYLFFVLAYYRWFVEGYFEYLVILSFFVKTFFHNESIVTSGTIMFMFFLGGSLKNFRLNKE